MICYALIYYKANAQQRIILKELFFFLFPTIITISYFLSVRFYAELISTDFLVCPDEPPSGYEAFVKSALNGNQGSWTNSDDLEECKCSENSKGVKSHTYNCMYCSTPNQPDAYYVDRIQKINKVLKVLSQCTVSGNSDDLNHKETKTKQQLSSTKKSLFYYQRNSTSKSGTQKGCTNLKNNLNKITKAYNEDQNNDHSSIDEPEKQQEYTTIKTRIHSIQHEMLIVTMITYFIKLFIPIHVYNAVQAFISDFFVREDPERGVSGLTKIDWSQNSELNDFLAYHSYTHFKDVDTSPELLEKLYEYCAGCKASENLVQNCKFKIQREFKKNEKCNLSRKIKHQTCVLFYIQTLQEEYSISLVTSNRTKSVRTLNGSAHA